MCKQAADEDGNVSDISDDGDDSSSDLDSDLEEEDSASMDDVPYTDDDMNTGIENTTKLADRTLGLPKGKGNPFAPAEQYLSDVLESNLIGENHKSKFYVPDSFVVTERISLDPLLRPGVQSIVENILTDIVPESGTGILTPFKLIYTVNYVYVITI